MWPELLLPLAVLQKLETSFSKSNAEKLVYVLITSSLDYFISLLL